MSFKTLFLTVILWIGFSEQGCQKPPDDDFFGCCEGIARFIDVEKLSLFHQNVSLSQGNASLRDYQLVLAMGGRFYGYYDLLQEKESIWAISLMSSAMACDCLGPGFGGSETEILKNITVITVNDFDEQHPAGSNINAMLLISDIGGNFVDKPLDVFIKQNNALISSPYLLLKPTKAPVKPFQVKVKIELSTGEQYEAESTTITIVP